MTKSRILYSVFAFAGLALGGVALGMWVVRLSERKPTAELAFGVDYLSNGGFRTFSSQVDQARSEVLVCAREITSRALLNSLISASTRGVKVKVLLDKDLNSEGSPRNAASYLINGGLSEIFLSASPLNAQFLLIDEKEKIYTTQGGWTSAAGESEVITPAFLVRNKQVVLLTRDFFLKMLTSAKKEEKGTKGEASKR